jgi:hypothetical protein
MITTAAALATAAIATAGATAYAASQGGPDAPDPRDYAAETRDTLQAKIDLAPQQYQAEETYRPLYDRLNLQEYEASLLGRPGGPRTESYTDMVPYQMPNPAYNAVSSSMAYPRMDRGGAASYVAAGAGQPQTITGYRPEVKTRTVNGEAEPGLLDIFQNQIAPRLRQIQTADRESELNDVATLGPKAIEAQRASNPGAASIVDSLVNRAKANLEGGLDPQEERALQQSVRGAQAARGVGYGPTDLFDEVVSSGVGGQELIRNRAAQALAASEGFYGNPFETILQRTAGGNAGGAQSMAATLNSGSGTPSFSPESPYAQDIYNTNFNAQSAAAISARNNQSAILGSLIGGAGQVGAGYMRSLY